mmetsp:Transcript_26259/g.36158  ORF Transcript_26259/g.36158 Transcript_26259/m.36158 type:complete len:160 (-) Transcript_26259:1426-1905(-)
MEVNYVLAITSRMISNYYRISYALSTSLVKTILVAEKDEEFDGDDHKMIIRSLIQHIVLEQRQLRSMNLFVLLVDEARQVEKVLQDGIHDILRWALLDEQIMGDGEEPLIVDLVMSSLNWSQFVKSTYHPFDYTSLSSCKIGIGSLGEGIYTKYQLFLS